MIKEKLKYILYTCLRFLWRQRRPFIRAGRAIGRGMLQLYYLLPLPASLRNIIKDIIFSVLQRIYRSSIYQSWNAQHIGMSRLRNWLKPPIEEEPVILPVAPDDAAWEALAKTALNPAEPVVDVIIPVYKGYDETLRCIYSAIAAAATNTTPHEIIVINDASPDKALSQKLRALAAQELFTLVEQKNNLGFVATANHGMQMHTGRDVLLLNADTAVYGDWLDRLRHAAYAQERTATATPLSNNAEICSYPYTARNNTMPLEVEDADLQSLAGEANHHQTCPLPTAVGFCMYIKRAVLDDIGYFDLKQFGAGYGEENDFCLRAATRGWEHVLAGDVFVRHWGGISFGFRKAQRIRRAMRIMARKFPDYHQQVQQFLIADPALPLRRRLDLARLSSHRKQRSILFISHFFGGGTERHINDMRMALEKEHVSAYMLRPHPLRYGIVEISHPLCPHTPNLFYDISTEAEALIDALQTLGINHIHIHHLIGFDVNFMDFIPQLASRLKVAYDFTAHDYYAACPRINLIGEDRVYCGEPDISVCENCVRKSGAFTQGLSVWNWRRRYADLFKHARHLYTPSNDAKKRLARYFPAAEFQLRPHTETAPANIPAFPTRKHGETLHVAILGAIGMHKGSDVLQACVKDAERRHLPIAFHVIGSTDFGNGASPYLTVTGEYKEKDVYELLAKQHCHIAFFPSVWPETYCYTLSIALNAGIFPVAFDLGAQADRINEVGYGKLLPISMAKDAAAINDALLNLQVTAPAPAMRYASYKNLLGEYYGNI